MFATVFKGMYRGEQVAIKKQMLETKEPGKYHSKAGTLRRRSPVYAVYWAPQEKEGAAHCHRTCVVEAATLLRQQDLLKWRTYSLARDVASAVSYLHIISSHRISNRPTFCCGQIVGLSSATLALLGKCASRRPQRIVAALLCHV